MPADTNDFRRVLAGEGISNFGSMLSRLALPWLATLALAATPLQMALLLVADVAAGAAGALFLGTLVDRLPKRSVMIVTDLARAGVLGGLAMLAMAQLLSIWLLAAAAALTGLFSVAFELARSAWVAQSVEAARLPARNAQLSAMGSAVGSGNAMTIGLVLGALGTLCIPLAPGATLLGAALLVAHQIVGDGGMTMFDVHDRTLRQTVVAPELLARVDGGLRSLGRLATLLGALGGGWLATALGARFAIGVMVALLVVAAVVAHHRLRHQR